jgi:hypothetical protein
MRPRRAAAGIVLGAAGMLASRLTGRREDPAPAVASTNDQVDPADPVEATHSSEDVERARAELAQELARRSARADNPPE